MEMIRGLFITHSLGFWVLLIGKVFKGNFEKFLSNATTICIKKFSENEWAKEYAEKECYERSFISACGSRWTYLKIQGWEAWPHAHLDANFKSINIC